MGQVKNTSAGGNCILPDESRHTDVVEKTRKSLEQITRLNTCRQDQGAAATLRMRSLKDIGHWRGHIRFDLADRWTSAWCDIFDIAWMGRHVKAHRPSCEDDRRIVGSIHPTKEFFASHTLVELCFCTRNPMSYIHKQFQYMAPRIIM